MAAIETEQRPHNPPGVDAMQAAVKAQQFVIDKENTEAALMLLARVEMHTRVAMEYAKEQRSHTNYPTTMEITLQHILDQIEKERKKLPVADRCHPTHVTRSSDASTFDEVCTMCGARDQSPGGWGRLKYPCPNTVKASMP